MELWVRSQDKTRLVKVDHIYYMENMFTNDVEDEYYICSGGAFDLGTYATKERALEVLDEIQRILQPKIIINHTSDDSLPIINGEWVKSIKAEMNYDTKELSTVVYEMPEK